MALSADGLFLAVGSPREASAATGVSGDQQDQSAKNAGAVYIFARNGVTWSQQAYLKASNTDSNDFFGGSVALSADGSSLVVGAPQEDSSSAGVNGDQGDNSVVDSGAAYVFVRGGATWTQQAYLKATSPKNTDVFGRAVTISADGNTVGVAAPYDTEARGAVYVFTRKGSAWGAPKRITASNPDPGDEFGVALSLAGDGQTLVVGAHLEKSSATTINGPENSNTTIDAGAAYVFIKEGDEWTKQAYLKASDSAGGHNFGAAVSAAFNGDLVAVGAPWANGKNLADNGAVYLFARAGATWTQAHLITASAPKSNDLFGYSVSLSSDGTFLVAGLRRAAQNPTASQAGAIQAFRSDGSAWYPDTVLFASNPGSTDWFSRSVSVSGDGSIVAVGSWREDGSSAGINGAPDEGASNAGAVYVGTR